jgi:NAD-dependent deacetylase
MDTELEKLLAGVRDRGERVVALTGAGVSAESGIPTFRGEDGYWTVGSRVYHPQEMATLAMYQTQPREVWRWYLYRRGVCNGAEPNDGHRALVRLDAALGDRFRLVTQNVDGLHLRAGSPIERTYQIHGNVNSMRCTVDCAGGGGVKVFPVPDDVPALGPDDALTEEVYARLACPACGAPARPHVLWFDECYDEALFFWDSALAAVSRAELLLVAGTSGATSLPMHMGLTALRRGAAIIDVNPDESPFAEMAAHSGRGAICRGPSGEVLPAIVEVLAGPA